MKTALCTTTLLAAASLASTAATIIQGASDTIAFEAEIGDIDNTFDTAGIGWEVDGVTSPLAGASGGSLVVATENSTTAAPSNLLSFDLNFTKTGNYTAWFRAAYTTQDYEDGRNDGPNNDSFHYENSTIGDVSQTWTTLNGLSGLSASVWNWYSGGATANVSTAGIVTWNVSNREDGFILDRIVLVHPDETATVNAAFLDGLANSSVAAMPEPSTTALLGLGGLALVLSRRK